MLVSCIYYINIIIKTRTLLNINVLFVYKNIIYFFLNENKYIKEKLRNRFEYVKKNRNFKVIFIDISVFSVYTVYIQKIKN